MACFSQLPRRVLRLLVPPLLKLSGSPSQPLCPVHPPRLSSRPAPTEPRREAAQPCMPTRAPGESQTRHPGRRQLLLGMQARNQAAPSSPLPLTEEDSAQPMLWPARNSLGLRRAASSAAQAVTSQWAACFPPGGQRGRKRSPWGEAGEAAACPVLSARPQEVNGAEGGREAAQCRAS